MSQPYIFEYLADEVADCSRRNGQPFVIPETPVVDADLASRFGLLTLSRMKAVCKAMEAGSVPATLAAFYGSVVGFHAFFKYVCGIPLSETVHPWASVFAISEKFENFEAKVVEVLDTAIKEWTASRGGAAPSSPSPSPDSTGESTAG